jgi:hypothetical protein
MMQFAQGHPITHRWLTFRNMVWNDMGSVKQLSVFQSAECALRSIRVKDLLSKASLVQSLSHDAGQVRPFGL